MKEINIRVAVASLSKKGCKFYKSDDGLEVIDVTKANDLGNKTWGYVDYFVRRAGYVLVGRHEYEINLKKQYGSSAGNAPKKVSKSQEAGEEPARKKEVQKKLHSYEDFAKDEKSSEYIHLLELNHLMTKFDRSIFKKTNKEQIDFDNTIRLFKVSKDTVPFHNQKIWSTRYEKFEQIPTNK